VSGTPSGIPVGVPPFEGILGHFPGPSTAIKSFYSEILTNLPRNFANFTPE
jgi:hypothetical protein